MAQDAQLSSYPGTPSESEGGSDDDSLPPPIEEAPGEVQCVMMSGALAERLKFRYDGMSSVGWLRRQVFEALKNEFSLQNVHQVVLFREDNVLRKDYIKLRDSLDGPCGHTVQILLLPNT